MSSALKAITLKNTIEVFFKNRNLNNTLTVNCEVNKKLLTIVFEEIGNEKQVIEIPIPYFENTIELIEYNSIKRPVGKYLLIENQQETMLDFMDMVHIVLCCENTITSRYLNKKGDFLTKAYYGFKNKNASVLIYCIQKTINDLITRLPLYTTDMGAWAMNRRVSIIDPAFEHLKIPAEKLAYHVNKAKKYFHKGWTSMGLSDGVMADHNYILTESLRKTIPFGFHFHNPQRNLYQTLGMVGAEIPLVRSNYMQKLMEDGVYRTGWNLFTVFVDIPDNFEDQIMLDTSVCEKFVSREKKIQCFGEVLVKEGDLVEKGTPLFVTPDGYLNRVHIEADKITVKAIEEKAINVGGVLEKGYEIILSYIRFIKEGTKITNLAANKGVVRIADLGYAINPVTGKKQKIEAMASCKATEKRQNFTQILEVLYNNLTDNVGVVVDDLVKFEMTEVESQLEEKGFPKDGTWECFTYAGHFNAVAGRCFWGVTKDVEDMSWEEADVVATNSKDLRVAGIKFSTVEFRALKTRFGNNNPITKEILSYAQGATDIKDSLNVLRTMRGMELPNKITLDYAKVIPVLQQEGIMLQKEGIENTVIDEYFMPDGFTMKLPVRFQTTLNEKGEIIFSGPDLHQNSLEGEARTYVTDKVYIPNSNLRRCWRHASGKWGLSEVGNLVNGLVTACHLYKNNPEDAVILTLLYKAINNYFSKISYSLGAKSGSISRYGMSVRYPYSVKGVAVLSNDLPKNTVQISKEMAQMLRISDGEVCLVERFPCLGFMSVRPQKVVIDPTCNKFIIRVSGNSLGSMGLDFDGDTLYIAAFHTKEAKECLTAEWNNPTQICYEQIKELNEKMGKPHFAYLTLQDYAIKPFELLSNDKHAEIVAKATGVKANTGPVVALAYNLMRMLENSDVKDNQKVNVAMEVFLDKVANSVFKQKHGVKSLHEVVTEAICTGDVEALVNEGFKKSTSITICDLIIKKAKEVGVKDLKWYYTTVTKQWGTTVINKIVRAQNKIYFASRSTLNGIVLIDHINTEPVDLPSKIFKDIINLKTVSSNFMDEEENLRLRAELNLDWTKNLFDYYAQVIENTLINKTT